MTTHADDPRLTAYILDELDADERAEVEAWLAADPAARARVEEIERVALALAGALKAEADVEAGSPDSAEADAASAAGLTAEQRSALLTGAAGDRRAAVEPRLTVRPSGEGLIRELRFDRRAWASLAAAVVLIGVGLVATMVDVGPALYWLEAVRSTSGHDSAERRSDYVSADRVTVSDLLRGRAPTGEPPRLAAAQSAPAAQPTPGLPPDIALVATPLAQMIMATAPPGAPAAAGAPALEVPWGYAPSAPADADDDVAVEFMGIAEEELAETDERWPPELDRMGTDPWNTEDYAHVEDNPFRSVVDEPLSTFSIDVDTASYSNVRRFLGWGELPPPGAVRIEEMVNYFPYDYAPPSPRDEAPFAANVEVGPAPWSPEHSLVRIGLKGREVSQDARPSANLVFLIDVSGSMDEPNKSPLVKDALSRLTRNLRADDNVAIVVYAGSSGLVLPPTSGADGDRILEAIGRLETGGSTNGGEGIRLAYDVARDAFREGGINRVILATDGDFNVGVTSSDELVRLVQDRARDGIYLSVLGFGMGNYNDAILEQLADRGNGNYAYIDNASEAAKVLGEQLAGTLQTIAKDVKIQVEFNPSRAAYYRLIGYENRVLANQDFNDDTKDAGEIGAGHTVTALYEVVPPGGEAGVPGVDPLRYQGARPTAGAADSNELLTLKLRYKEPDADSSKLLTFVVPDEPLSLGATTEDFRFAAAVASLGMLLRSSPYAGDATVDRVVDLARGALGPDDLGYRAEFVEIARSVGRLIQGRAPAELP